MPVAEQKLIDREVAPTRVLDHRQPTQKEQQGSADHRDRRSLREPRQARCPENESNGGVEHHRRQSGKNLDEDRQPQDPSGNRDQAQQTDRDCAEQRDPVLCSKESANHRDTDESVVAPV